MKGCNRLTRTGVIVAAAIVVGIATYFAFAASAVAARAAAFPNCPTQQQLVKRGATKTEVQSAPQVSTGTFPLTAKLTVPDEQCRYQGSWLLTIVYWHVSRVQLAAAISHFLYECKTKNCSVFVSKGANVESTTTGGKTTTKSVPTLNEVVLGGRVTGEASAVYRSPDPPCDVFADVLYFVLAGATPTRSISPQVRCP